MISKLTKQELIILANKICHAEYSTEKERSKLIQQFADNVPHNNVYSLIFSKENEHLTPEEIVEKALAHKPFVIHLGGPKGNS